MICTGRFVCSEVANEQYMGLFLMGKQGNIDLVAGQDTTMLALCVGKYSNPTFVVVPPFGGCEQIPENQFTTNLGLLYMPDCIQLTGGMS
jgi:hypothetical protein